MEKAKMRTAGKILCSLLPLVIFASGCTYQRRYSFKPLGLPEEVYVSTPSGRYYTPDIAVFSFRSDGYTWQVGEKASRLLCTEMLKQGIGANIVFNNTVEAMTSEELATFAWNNKYDYIVTGEVLYFLNGGNTTHSRVEEEIKIYSVTGRQLQVVGYAKAVEAARPLPETDFFLVTGRGATAPSAETLLERNAGKFARLMAGMFSPNGTTH